MKAVLNQPSHVKRFHILDSTEVAEALLPAVFNPSYITSSGDLWNIVALFVSISQNVTNNFIAAALQVLSLPTSWTVILQRPTPSSGPLVHAV